MDHSLELDHLIDPKRITRTELTKQELSAVNAAASVMRTIGNLYAQETFTNEVCRDQLCNALQIHQAPSKVPKKHCLILQQLQDIINRLAYWEEDNGDEVKMEKKKKRKSKNSKEETKTGTKKKRLRREKENQDENEKKVAVKVKEEKIWA